MNQSKFAEQIQSEPDQPDIVIIQGENDSNNGINDAKRKIKDMVIQFKIRDFVAITDPVDQKKISMVEKKDAERLDPFHCRHCGMEFIDEIQLGIQRLHSPI